MKFTSIAVLAVLFASTSAVHLVKKDDSYNVKTGVAYDLDVPALNRAEADNAAKTQANNGATAAQATAANNHAVAVASATATAAATGGWKSAAPATTLSATAASPARLRSQ